MIKFQNLIKIWWTKRIDRWAIWGRKPSSTAGSKGRSLLAIVGVVALWYFMYIFEITLE